MKRKMEDIDSIEKNSIENRHKLIGLIIRGDYKEAKSLIINGHDVKQKGCNGATALDEALCTYQRDPIDRPIDLELVQMLIEHGSKLDEYDLICAVGRNNFPLVKLLLEKGVPIYTFEGGNILSVAALTQTCGPNIIKYLLDNVPNIDDKILGNAGEALIFGLKYMKNGYFIDENSKQWANVLRKAFHLKIDLLPVIPFKVKHTHKYILIGFERLKTVVANIRRRIQGANCWRIIAKQLPIVPELAKIINEMIYIDMTDPDPRWTGPTIIFTRSNDVENIENDEYDGEYYDNADNVEY